MENTTVLKWLCAIIALMIFLLPVLLADELSLLANYLLAFSCWAMVIAFGAYTKGRINNTNKPR